jgi:hypothetical protein
VSKNVTVATSSEDGQINETIEPLDPTVSVVQGDEEPTPEATTNEVVEELGAEKPIDAEEEGKEEEETVSAKPEDSSEQKPRKNRAQERITKLTEEKYQGRARIEELERQLAEKSIPETEMPVNGVNPKPQQENFPTDEEYWEALSEYMAERKFKDYQAQETARFQEEERGRVFEVYNERADIVRKVQEDFDEVVGDSNFKIPNAAIDTVFELENGPEVAYHLATHPDICKKLMSMSDRRSVAEIGKISATLGTTIKENGASPDPTAAFVAAGQTPAPVKPTSSAPKPIKPVGAGATKTKLPLDHPDVKPAEYRSRRDAGEV